MEPLARHVQAQRWSRSAVGGSKSALRLAAMAPVIRPLRWEGGSDATSFSARARVTRAACESPVPASASALVSKIRRVRGRRRFSATRACSSARAGSRIAR